jgi:hypothetical protein
MANKVIDNINATYYDPKLYTLVGIGTHDLLFWRRTR